jgi:hypothetical protein
MPPLYLFLCLSLIAATAFAFTSHHHCSHVSNNYDANIRRKGIPTVFVLGTIQMKGKSSSTELFPAPTSTNGTPSPPLKTRHSSSSNSNKEMSRNVDPTTIPCQWLRLFWVVLMMMLHVALPVAASTTTHYPEAYSYWQVLDLVNAPALPSVNAPALPSVVFQSEEYSYWQVFGLLAAPGLSGVVGFIIALPWLIRSPKRK